MNKSIKVPRTFEERAKVHVPTDVTLLPPVTPGEVLWHDFMEPIGLTKYRLAKEIGVPPQRIGAIVAGSRSVTADTDLRLCRYFGLTEGYWLRMQSAHDLQLARRTIADDLARITPLPRPKRAR